MPSNSSKAEPSSAAQRLDGRAAVLFVGLASFGFAVDLLTKHWAFSRLGMPGEGGRLAIVGDVLKFETSINEGALFGMGQGRQALFICMSIAAACGIVYWLFGLGAARDRWLTCALGGICGGIAGNLYDRLGLPRLVWTDPLRRDEPVYGVRDWIHFELEPWLDWPVFNVADCLLVVGVTLLVWHTLRTPSPALVDDTAGETPSA